MVTVPLAASATSACASTSHVPFNYLDGCARNPFPKMCETGGRRGQHELGRLLRSMAPAASTRIGRWRPRFAAAAAPSSATSGRSAARLCFLKKSAFVSDGRIRRESGWPM